MGNNVIFAELSKSTCRQSNRVLSLCETTSNRLRINSAYDMNSNHSQPFDDSFQSIQYRGKKCWREFVHAVLKGNTMKSSGTSYYPQVVQLALNSHVKV